MLEAYEGVCKMLSKTTGEVRPYLISLVGVVSDYLTTTIGLGRGFYETNASYNPFFALTIFWGCLAVFTLALPKTRIWSISKNMLASISFLGAVNNTLVILNVFSGLKI